MNAYSLAIQADPLNTALYTNRSLCHIKMEAYGLAIADASMATELDPKCVKAYYRLGSAYMGMGKYKEARANYRKACQLKPNDRDAAVRLKECDKEVKRQAFEKVRTARPCTASPRAPARAIRLCSIGCGLCVRGDVRGDVGCAGVCVCLHYDAYSQSSDFRGREARETTNL